MKCLKFTVAHHVPFIVRQCVALPRFRIPFVVFPHHYLNQRELRFSNTSVVLRLRSSAARKIRSSAQHHSSLMFFPLARFLLVPP